MGAKRVVDRVWDINLGQVHAFFIDAPEGGVLIDTGNPGDAERIFSGLARVGRRPADVKHIVLTHAHPDHIGSVAALQRVTGAEIWVHGADAEIVRTGTGFRPLRPGPGLLRKLMIALVKRWIRGSVEPTPVDHEIVDGEQLPGGLRAIHTPGHCAGQVALFYPRQGGVLFVADAAMHVVTLGLSIGYEDQALGELSLARLSREDFTVACFGHGRTITRGAAAQFRALWPA